MLKITNVKVYDLKESIIASGNAMRTEQCDYTEEEFKKGLERMKKLVKTSRDTNVHCHDNALTGIRVSFDVLYPNYWTPEFQRYHFADIVTSSSKMHRLCKMEIRKSTNKYVSPSTISEIQKHVDNYNNIVNNESICTFSYVNTDDKEDKLVKVFTREESIYTSFMVMISNCPMGIELFMRISTNYKQLQTIYNQRKNHKLKEDWGEFCRFVENLPYSEYLLTI